MPSARMYSRRQPTVYVEAEPAKRLRGLGYGRRLLFGSYVGLASLAAVLIGGLHIRSSVARTNPVPRHQPVPLKGAWREAARLRLGLSPLPLMSEVRVAGAPAGIKSESMPESEPPHADDVRTFTLANQADGLSQLSSARDVVAMLPQEAFRVEPPDASAAVKTEPQSQPYAGLPAQAAPEPALPVATEAAPVVWPDLPRLKPLAAPAPSPAARMTKLAPAKLPRPLNAKTVDVEPPKLKRKIVVVEPDDPPPAAAKIAARPAARPAKVEASSTGNASNVSLRTFDDLSRSAP